MRCVRVSASSGSYDVRIGSGLLEQLGENLKTCTGAKRCVLVMGENVNRLYGDRVLNAIQNAGLTVSAKVFPAGEATKCLKCYGELLEFLAEQKLTRSDCLVALGGGVTGDLTGFAAATYQRGIDYIQIPTTLLAAVDSSVGGKTAIDLSAGKNQVGAFWQPKLVLCDTDTLKTLPEREMTAGMAEVIKYAVLEDADLFDRLQHHDIEMEEIIETCIRLKAEIVGEDEKDTGRRRLLNLGHSFGHAVESCSEYRILHGEAVAIGMAMICRAAVRQGYMDSLSCPTVISLLKEYGLPVSTDYQPEDLMEALLLDKKFSGGKMHLVVPKVIGWCQIVSVNSAELRKWLEAAYE